MPVEIQTRHLGLVDALRGMILVTGPAGSGRTTTIHATLDLLRGRAPKVGDAQALKNYLEQDPDVIVAGTIGDSATATLAARAGLSGRLVLAEVDAGDSADAIRRFLEWGVDGELLSTSLAAVFAQRLARRICPRCRIEAAEPPEVLEDLKLGGVLGGAKLFTGAGCAGCGRTGAMGRVALFEFWAPGEEARDRLAGGPDDRTIRRLAQMDGMTPLVVDAIRKVRDGVISLAELRGAVPYNQILRAEEFLSA